jgi:hypothetical protein
MSRKPQQPNLAALLADSAGSKRKKEEPQPQPQFVEPASQQKPREQKGLRPITVHFPTKVRDQLKILAAEQSKPMQALIGEAYNDLFAKYGKPEIAPTQQAR